MSDSEESKKDYYEILRLPRDATQEDIKNAFKEISVVYHPDSNFFDEILDGLDIPGLEPSAADDVAKFQEITNAYHTLANPEKRAKYDAELAKEEISKGVQKTSEWTRPDGSVANKSYDRKERQPTQTDLQRLQRKYEERSKVKVQSVAEILGKEEFEEEPLPVFYITIGLVLVILLGVATAFFLF